MKRVDITLAIPDSPDEVFGDHKRAKAFLYDLVNRLNGDVSSENIMKALDDMVSFMVELSSKIVMETFSEILKEKSGGSPGPTDPFIN